MINRLQKEDANANILSQMIILLDEPDTFLHPEWSRKLIQMILNDLGKYKKIKFNIIITTNSPFMLSDVLPQNILKIYHKEKTIEETRYVRNAELGFGSNILDILSESFFLNDLFGSFSTNKIEEAIEQIEQLESIDDNKIQSIETFIEIVGDKIVQTTLRNMLDEKVSKIKLGYSIKVDGRKFLDSHEGIKEAIGYLEAKLNSEDTRSYD